jgi:hypothetical protein
MSTPVVLACVGGFAINILHLVEYSKRPAVERPDFRDMLFYVPYLAWPVLGGVLAFAYIESGVHLSPILALNVGLSAPLILRAMVEANPIRPRAIDPGHGA